MAGKAKPKPSIEPEVEDQVGPKLGKLYERSITLYRQLASETKDSIWDGTVDQSVEACGMSRNWSGPLVRLLKLSGAIDSEGRRGHFVLLGEPSEDAFRLAQDRTNEYQMSVRDVKLSELNKRVAILEGWVKAHDLA